MKKNILQKIVILGVFLICLGCVPAYGANELPALKVQGTKLVNSSGKTVQLRGISTHGLSWFPEYVNKSAFQYMKSKWKINAVHLAMYTAEYNGYCTGDASNRKRLEKLIDKGVQYATDAGLYVIIDWHILSDGNPLQYQSQSLAFFKKMAKKYKNHTNVIYEICNEPNGGISWSSIRKYAEKIISGIRLYDKNAVILVGTPTWSQDVDQAAKNPVSKKYKNIMYSLHFYAATHKGELRAKAEKAIKAGLPLFVSEFGICDASGNGAIDKSEAKRWLSFLDKNKISYIAWNLSNKNESSAFIKSNCTRTTGWTSSNLTEGGLWLVKWFKKS